jgi:ankyrin repeat protein
MGASETVIASDYPDSTTDLFELALRLEPTNNQTQIIALLEDSFRDKYLTGKDLFFSVRKGLVRFVVDILNRETINPLEKNHLGFTVLQEAIFGHHLEILNLLLARGARPYIDSDVDYLKFAILNSLGNKVIHDMLRMGFKSHLSDSDTLPLWTNLHHAVETNDLDLVKMLIDTDTGSSINELRQNPTTQTPLMNAVSRSQLEMSELLIELGADLTVRDEHGTKEGQEEGDDATSPELSRRGELSNPQ